jgi:hypothetical protein
MGYSQRDCQNGRRRAKTAKMAAYSTSCAKQTANMAMMKFSPKNFSYFFFLQTTIMTV